LFTKFYFHLMKYFKRMRSQRIINNETNFSSLQILIQEQVKTVFIQTFTEFVLTVSNDVKQKVSKYTIFEIFILRYNRWVQSEYNSQNKTGKTESTFYSLVLMIM